MILLASWGPGSVLTSRHRATPPHPLSGALEEPLGKGRGKVYSEIKE